MATRGRVLVVTAVAVSAALVGAYLAAGGASYAPAKTRDPCKPRPWREVEGLDRLAEQFTLSALDGAACKLGVSREALAEALTSPAERRRFLRRYGIDDTQLARAVRAGLLRAVDDAERAGALSPFLAGPLREAIRSVPLDQVVALVGNIRRLLDGAQGLLGPAGGLLEGLLPLGP